jgi:hypothetical protein
MKEICGRELNFYLLKFEGLARSARVRILAKLQRSMEKSSRAKFSIRQTVLGIRLLVVGLGKYKAFGEAAHGHLSNDLQRLLRA